VIDVVCLGIVVADTIARPVDELPAHGTLGLVNEVSLCGGGCALNTATGLVRLGRNVMLAGKVGADAPGDFLRGLAQKRGIDTSGLLQDAGVATAASVVLVDATGERTFLHSPGASRRLSSNVFPEELLFGTRILHLAGALVMPALDGAPMAALLSRAQQRGVITSLDTAFDATGTWSRVEPCLPHLDLFSASVAEAQAISGHDDPRAMSAWFRERGVGDVTIKLGPDGCYASGDGFEGHVGPFAVEAMDGTGAGDAYLAGLLHGRLAGWPLDKAARFANAAGALATTATGATEGLRGLAEVDALMASRRDPSRR
jgi:sugar/nucleoside kinase (ribokinase family)